MNVDGLPIDRAACRTTTRFGSRPARPAAASSPPVCLRAAATSLPPRERRAKLQTRDSSYEIGRPSRPPARRGAGQHKGATSAREENRETRTRFSLALFLVRSRQSPALLSLSHPRRRRTSFSRSCQEPPFWTTLKISKIDHFRPKVVQMSQIDQIWSWRGRLTLQKGQTDPK